MKNLVNSTLLVLSATFVNSGWALSPPNINTDIHWTDTGGIHDPSSGTFTASFNGVIDIETAFNHARREEEIQLGLPANKLGNLDLPSQADWDKMTDDAKALLIINEERQDRAGMLPGVIGLPLAGIESHMDNISKDYGDLLHDTDTIGHSQPSGNPSVDSPFIRIEQDADIGSLNNCHEFLARAENLAFFATTGNSIPLPLERSIYSFIYDDSGSAWGHREAALIQDETLNQVGSHWGFSNNHASASSEGYLGVYVRSSPEYKPFSSFNSNFGSVVVMNIFDPVDNSPACNYNVALDSSNSRNQQGKVPTLNIPTNKWVQIGINTEPATGNNTLADIIGDDITAAYGTNWVVYSYQSSNNTYKKLGLTDALVPGVGYWIIQLTGNPVTIDMPNSSSSVYVTHTAACTSNAGCFEIPLSNNISQSQWQMIGYPFRDSRNMDKVTIVTNSGVCSTGCGLNEASNEGLVIDSLWHYDGTSYQQLSSGGPEKFDPWDGAWIAILPAADGLEAKILIPATN